MYRLGRSKYRDKFALKGATLFTLWTGQTHRPTKDLDLFGRGLSSTIKEVEAIIRGICAAREDDEYDGVPVKLQAELAGARIPMQVEAPLIRAYPREATIAEEFKLPRPHDGLPKMMGEVANDPRTGDSGC